MNSYKKAIFFDFDGTLTIGGENPARTLLKKSGIPSWFFDKVKKRYCGGFLHKFAKPQLIWQIFTKFFVRAGICRADFDEVIKNIKTIKNLDASLAKLKQMGYAIFCVSGGMKTIIEGVLKENLKYFDDISACDVQFSDDGKLKKIISHGFDNEGKAKYVSMMLAKYGIKSENAVFVGNDNNDVYVKSAGVKTFCLNADNKSVRATDKSIWSDHEEGVDDLLCIVDRFDNLIEPKEEVVLDNDFELLQASGF